MKEITRLESLELICAVRKSIKSNINVSLDDVLDEYSGVTNEFLSEICTNILGERSEVVGEIDLLLKCPCCGYCTLSELYCKEAGTGYDICRFCGWEDDGTIETDKDIYKSINKGSMSDYRKKAEIIESITKFNK